MGRPDQRRRVGEADRKALTTIATPGRVDVIAGDRREGVPLVDHVPGSADHIPGSTVRRPASVLGSGAPTCLCRSVR